MNKQSDNFILNHLPFATLLLDSKNNILYFNKFAEKILNPTLQPFHQLRDYLQFAFPENEQLLKFEKAYNQAKQILQSEDKFFLGIHKCQISDHNFKYYSVELCKAESDYLLIFYDRINTREIINENLIEYKQLPELPLEGILVHENGIAVHANKAFTQVLGYSIDELSEQNLIDLLIEPLDRDKIDEYLKMNYNRPCELNMVRKNGEVFPAQILGEEILFKGEKSRIITIRDISERKEKENELIEHQLFIQRITEQSPDIIYIYDVEKKKNIYINKDLGEILGYNKSELPNSSIEVIKMLIHPGDLKQFETFYEIIHLQQKDFVFEFNFRLKSKHGEWRWFAGKEKEFQRRGGKIITMIGTLQDISTQKEYEQALLESEEQLSTIFENAPMIMVLTTMNGRILKMNKTAYQLTGKTKLESLNQTFGEAFNCVDSFEKEKGCRNCIICKTIEKTNESKENQHKIEAVINLKKDGQIREHFFLISTTIMKRMTPPAILITLDEITDRKLMEIDLKDAKEKAEESNKLKTAFLQNMSHEIRTPMNGIIGFSEMLNRPDISEERRQFYTEVIVKSSHQLLNIVNDILDISKIETGLVESNENEININSLLSELFAFFKPQAWKKQINMFLHLPFEDEDAVILSDEMKLNQILNNLLANALKFTHKGYIKLGYELINNELQFYVEDSGIGIEKSYHDKIFEQFRQLELTTTRKYGGTGLGLSISRAYAKLLRGRLWLDSEIDKGTTFYLTIPYKKLTKTPKPDSSSSENPLIPLRSGNQAIILAEDEELNYLYLKEVIDAMNITTLWAKDGEQAIEMIKNNEVALVLLDIKMPKINGYQAITEIKKIKPNLPVVAQTAFATEQDKIQILKAGFDDYIPKPILIEKLQEILQKYLNI